MTEKCDGAMSDRWFAGFGIGRLLFYRCRTMLLIALAGLASVFCLTHTPFFGRALGNGKGAFLVLASQFLIGRFSAWLALIDDTGAEERFALPIHLLVRPIKTSDLVGWSMFWVSAATLGLWLACVECAFLPLGLHFEFFRMTIVLAAATSVVVWLTWLLKSFPGIARIALPLLALLAPYSERVAQGYSLPVVAALSIGAIVLSGILSFYTLRLLRYRETVSLDDRDWFGTWAVKSPIERPVPLYASIFAQMRIEWQGSVPALAFIGFILYQLSFGNRSADIGGALLQMGLLTTFITSSVSGTPTSAHDGRVLPFVALRPMSSAEFGVAEEAAALLRAIAAWAILLIIAALFFHQYPNSWASSSLFLLVETWRIPPLVFIIFGMLVTWKLSMLRFCVKLTGGKVLNIIYVLLMMLPFLFVTVSGRSVPALGTNFVKISSITTCLWGLRLLLMAASAWLSVRRGVLSAPSAMIALLVWGLCVGLLVWGCGQTSLFEANRFLISWMLLLSVPGVALFLPGMAFDLSRHK